jgi:nitroreductase
MKTFDALSKRASVRAYRKEPIEDALLEKLVDAGRRAPTARAVEPWEFVVIRDRGMLQKLGEIATSGSFVKDAASAIVIFCHETKYYLEDGCAATENILLAASDLGIGACWIAGDKKPYAETVMKLLGARQELRLISIIALGWPEKETPQSKARPLKDVIHWERY